MNKPTQDATTTINDLKNKVHDFISARDWEQYHHPKNLAMGIAVEAAEIMEHFQWETIDEARQKMKDGQVRKDVGEEIADVMIYLLSFCNAMDMDLSDEVTRKLKRNETRFPPEQWKGKARGE